MASKHALEIASAHLTAPCQFFDREGAVQMIAYPLHQVLEAIRRSKLRYQLARKLTLSAGPLQERVQPPGPLAPLIRRKPDWLACTSAQRRATASVRALGMSREAATVGVHPFFKRGDPRRNIDFPPLQALFGDAAVDVAHRSGAPPQSRAAPRLDSREGGP